MVDELPKFWRGNILVLMKSRVSVTVMIAISMLLEKRLRLLFTGLGIGVLSFEDFRIIEQLSEGENQ